MTDTGTDLSVLFASDADLDTVARTIARMTEAEKAELLALPDVSARIGRPVVVLSERDRKQL